MYGSTSASMPQGPRVCAVVLHGRWVPIYLRAAAAQQRPGGRQVPGAHEGALLPEIAEVVVDHSLTFAIVGPTSYVAEAAHNVAVLTSAMGSHGCVVRQVCKPAASVDVAEPITELDLYVGAVITIHQRTFELLEADEFTMQATSAVHQRQHRRRAWVAPASMSSNASVSKRQAAVVNSYRRAVC